MCGGFWKEEYGHVVGSKGGKGLDGAILMMPLFRFVSSTDPAWLATLDAIGKRLADDGLVMRYDTEKAATWTPTQTASAHLRRARQTPVPLTPTAMLTTPARNTHPPPRRSAYAPGSNAPEGPCQPPQG